MKLFSYSTQTCPLYSAGDVRVVIGWDDAPPVTNALPPNILFDESYAFSALSDIGSGAGYNWRFELDVSLPPMLIDVSEGTPKYWIMFIGTCIADQIVNLGAFTLSPRTDIPAWFWSSTRNRVAPGGIVVPP